MDEKTITISVTEDERRLWRQFKDLGWVRDEELDGKKWPGIARTLRKKVEKELERLE